jgi:hypothetical protein
LITPNFEPWKPPGDDPRFMGIRLLILGESHYDEGETYSPEVQKEFTKDIVKRWGAEAEGYRRFFANVYRTFNESDGHHSSEDFRSFWTKVFFYNYVQELVSGGPRQRPSSPAWASSADAFHSVLDDVKPEAVVVVGKTTWNMMSERNAERIADDPDGLGPIWRYDYEGGACYVAHTNHPSKTGYSATEWRPRVSRFLEWVRGAIT